MNAANVPQFKGETRRCASSNETRTDDDTESIHHEDARSVLKKLDNALERQCKHLEQGGAGDSPQRAPECPDDVKHDAVARTNIEK